MITDAMKLNIIVVTTSWLPCLAFRYPGIAPQIPPNTIDAITASGKTIKSDQFSSQRQSNPTASPPIYACPSAPILNKPQWKPIANPRPVKIKLVV